jgi:hypothetical protein
MAATSAPSGAAPQNQSAPPDRRRWLILALIGLAQLMIVLDGTFPPVNTYLAATVCLPGAERAPARDHPYQALGLEARAASASR